MDTTFVWALIAMLTAIGFVSRASFILLFPRITLPRGVQRGLRFVPAAVFTALIAPDVFLSSGALELGSSNPKAAAALIAGAVAWRTRNTLATILAGMAALHLLRTALLG